MSIKQFVNSFGWFLYGGVSCYCLQRFFMDFKYVTNDENHPLFQTGDIVVLDVWNRLKLERYELMKRIV